MKQATQLLLICFVLLAACSKPSNGFVETVGDTDFKMLLIPAGTFQMGCGLKDEPCEKAEWIDFDRAIRQAPIEVESFYMAETETTWSLYQQCIDESVCEDNTADGGDNGWGKNHFPVIEISFEDVKQSFLPWLKQKTGRSYRLPTEAEWEYAARADNQQAYGFGSKINCNQAQFGYVSDECGKPTSTVPVKSYAPNKFGLYDMHGNVWEFVDACWQNNPQSFKDVFSSCEEIVLRGGSWLNHSKNLRSAARFHHNRTYRESGDGFRLALSLL